MAGEEQPIEEIQQAKKAYSRRLELLRQQAREVEQQEKIAQIKIDLHIAVKALDGINQCIAQAQKAVDDAK